GEKTRTDGKSWRDASNGGWFSWEIKVQAGQAEELHVKYWGGDAGGREFDIFVDGEKLATQKLENNRPGEYYEEIYPLPARMTQGKEKVTVKFLAHPSKMAGGVFGCAILSSGK
ncbi:MAG: DUF6805 domain-containing protein, partial [Sedimentisphaerales bacterium]